MQKRTKIIMGASVWAVFVSIMIFAFVASCSQEEPIAEKPSQEGLLLNDDLVAIKEDDGKKRKNLGAASWNTPEQE